LLAGAIGVSNIMMVTVKERTVEIGIRRAIGATLRDILSQIMLESVSLTLIAGMFGIMFSVLVLSVAEKIVAASGEFTPAFQIGFWLAVAAAALLAVLGMLAGLAPALRAMNIKPVDAMRDE
jgi:putative ABC transport system permease protein